MRNKEIREKIAKTGLKYYMVADVLGINQFTFSHWLQLELPDQKKEAVLNAIDRACEVWKDEI